MSLEGIDLMYRRLQHLGGFTSQDRMTKGKERTFAKAANSSSYQACIIKVNDDYKCQAMINPDKTKYDYDDKILSTTADVKAGDIIEWMGTNTKWLIVLPELTEKAYFRGGIRRCQYKIHWLNKADEHCETWAAIRGPVETKIVEGSKSSILHDSPNNTLHIIVPKNDDNIEMFKRYSRFIFNQRAWKVEASDDISTEGIIDFTAQEDYVNEDIDDLEEEIAERVIIEKIDPNLQNVAGARIYGETFIVPQVTYEYHIKGIADDGDWEIVESNRPLTYEVKDNRLFIKWSKNRAGQFTIKYTKDDISVTRTIVVESLY